jgi:ParB family chromosome partitioning protein
MARRDMTKMFSGASQAAQKFSEIEKLRAELETLKQQKNPNGTDFKEIPVDQIVALRLPDGMGQPRKYFDPGSMESLRDSIRKHGVLEPILVRPANDGLFETVSGERRWRCCVELQKPAILARVREMDDQEALEVALIATLFSESVSAVEEADSLLALIKLYLGITDDHDNREIKRLLVATKNYRQTGYGDISPDRADMIERTLESFGLKLGSFVSNRLPLLDMAESILQALRLGQVSPTNAILINRAPSVFHAELIQTAGNLTKKELQSKIATLKNKASYVPKESFEASNENNNAGIIEIDAAEIQEAQEAPQDWIYYRIKAIRRKKKLVGDRRVQTRLGRAQKALEEISDIAKELGIEI